MADRYYEVLLIAELILAPVVFLLLLFITAPYGRFDRKGWGPVISSRAAWMIMESPSLVLPVLLALGAGVNRVELVFLLIWLCHYFHRAAVYPFRISSPRKPFSVLIMSWGFIFNIINSYVNFYYLFYLAPHRDLSWLNDIRFIAGGLLFAGGYLINKKSDSLLRKLRADGRTGYFIPEGGLYRWISAPNYLGEMIEWGGWALLVWSLPGTAFFLFTIANLLPRALKIHKWYGETFASYPEERKAIVPFFF
ncbi:MAG: 3-oxo-5-alpha-steroid 4-dehydrogenase [Spirochaetales bacterium]|nr:3-oxo-5-alpha-steroid 4-dehydrogenase [Spirochaetales bacterium]